jgi:hypothetical protein
MKKILLLLTMFTIMVAGTAQAHEKCELKLEPAGIYHVHCPSGTLVQATATNGNIGGNPRFPQLFLRTEVRCVRPLLLCGEALENYVEKNVDTDLDL